MNRSSIVSSLKALRAPARIALAGGGVGVVVDLLLTSVTIGFDDRWAESVPFFFCLFAGLALWLRAIVLDAKPAVPQCASRQLPYAIVIYTVSAIVMCLPLLWVFWTGGDNPRSNRPLLEGELLFFLSPLLPAVAVFIASGLKHTQPATLGLLLLMFLLELVNGITPTNQLNHEGTDLGFWFYGVSLFLMTIVAVVGIHCIRLARRA